MEEYLKKFDKIFNEETVFDTDNFEDEGAINHPCYSHYGVVVGFRAFLVKTIESERQKAYEKAQNKEFAERKEWMLKAKEEIEQKVRQQALLELLAHFSEYNVPLTMTAKDVQSIIINFMKEDK